MSDANTIKPKTVVYFMLGLFVPLWPISLPFFWWKAYKAYKTGVEAPTVSIYELEKAAELHKAGLLTAGELDKIKSTTTGLNRM